MNLHLVLTHYWFDEIANGNKTIEYREIKPHWTRLIWERRESLETVTFQRAYTQSRLKRKIQKIDIGECPYDGWDGQYYRIHIVKEATE